MTATATAVISAARDLCGTAWRHRGRSKRTGVDCIGLVMLATRGAGLDLFAHCGISDRAYERKPQRQLFTLVEQHCSRITEPVPGALLFFQFPGDEYPRHFAIYTESQTMIHAEGKTRRKVIEHGYRSSWVRWTHSVWKLPGVIYA